MGKFKLKEEISIWFINQIDKNYFIEPNHKFYFTWKNNKKYNLWFYQKDSYFYFSVYNIENGQLQTDKVFCCNNIPELTFTLKEYIFNYWLSNKCYNLTENEVIYLKAKASKLKNDIEIISKLKDNYTSKLEKFIDERIFYIPNNKIEKFILNMFIENWLYISLPFSYKSYKSQHQDNINHKKYIILWFFESSIEKIRSDRSDEFIKLAEIIKDNNN